MLDVNIPFKNVFTPPDSRSIPSSSTNMIIVVLREDLDFPLLILIHSALLDLHLRYIIYTHTAVVVEFPPIHHNADAIPHPMRMDHADICLSSSSSTFYFFSCSAFLAPSFCSWSMDLSSFSAFNYKHTTEVSLCFKTTDYVRRCYTYVALTLTGQRILVLLVLELLLL
jgi:hypothetical protein